MAKEAAEAEKRKEERRRRERRNRDAFTALLREHLAAGRLNCKTRFKVHTLPLHTSHRCQHPLCNLLFPSTRTLPHAEASYVCVIRLWRSSHLSCSTAVRASCCAQGPSCTSAGVCGED